MKEIYTKRITRMPDSLPVRSEKGIEVDSTDGKVTDIYVVDETGRKRIDLDGNVKESYSKTITANGSVTIGSAEYGEEYTSVKEVSVTVDVPIGPVVPVNPGEVDTLAELADYAKLCNVYGAVLSVDNEKYLIWNDVEGSQTWNPSAIEDTPVAPSGHGTNIAICIGDGVWVMTGWAGLTNKLKFAAYTTQLYTFVSECIKGSGKDNSDYILTHYSSEINSTNTPLWDALKTLRETYTGAYIPNNQELINICFKLVTAPSEPVPPEYNTNIAKVFGVGTDNYWSSSQYWTTPDFAIHANYFDGTLSYNNKSTGYKSFACLSFD